MKIHITDDKANKIKYYATRKEAIEAINANPYVFPKAIGCHYSFFTHGGKKSDIVHVLNQVSKYR